MGCIGWCGSGHGRGHVCGVGACGWLCIQARPLPRVASFLGTPCKCQILDVRQSGSSILVTFRRQKPRIRLTARAQKYLLTPWADINQAGGGGRSCCEHWAGWSERACTGLRAFCHEVCRCTSLPPRASF